MCKSNDDEGFDKDNIVFYIYYCLSSESPSWWFAALEGHKSGELTGRRGGPDRLDHGRNRANKLMIAVAVVTILIPSWKSVALDWLTGFCEEDYELWWFLSVGFCATRFGTADRAGSNNLPDRTFHNSRASKTLDRGFWTTFNLLIDGFCGFKIVKCFVRRCFSFSAPSNNWTRNCQNETATRKLACFSLPAD